MKVEFRWEVFTRGHALREATNVEQALCIKIYQAKWLGRDKQSTTATLCNCKYLQLYIFDKSSRAPPPRRVAAATVNTVCQGVSTTSRGPSQPGGVVRVTRDVETVTLTPEHAVA